MRKVTEQVMTAFIKGDSKSVGNTMTDGRIVWLHGNEIACRHDDGTIWVSLAGWPTVTTRERLNGLATLLNSTMHFYQRDWETFVGKLTGDEPAEDYAWYCLPF